MAPLAAGLAFVPTPAGGAELPGSGAPTSAQLEACEPPPPAAAEVVAVVPLSPVEQAVRRADATAAVPSTPIVRLMLDVIFNASPQGSTPALVRDRS